MVKPTSEYTWVLKEWCVDGPWRSWSAGWESPSIAIFWSKILNRFLNHDHHNFCWSASQFVSMEFDVLSIIKSPRREKKTMLIESWLEILFCWQNSGSSYSKMFFYCKFSWNKCIFIYIYVYMYTCISYIPLFWNCATANDLHAWYNAWIALINPYKIKYAIFPKFNNKPPRNKVRQKFWGNQFFFDQLFWVTFFLGVAIFFWSIFWGNQFLG